MICWSLSFSSQLLKILQSALTFISPSASLCLFTIFKIQMSPLPTTFPDCPSKFQYVHELWGAFFSSSSLCFLFSSLFSPCYSSLFPGGFTAHILQYFLQGRSHLFNVGGDGFQSIPSEIQPSSVVWGRFPPVESFWNLTAKFTIYSIWYSNGNLYSLFIMVITFATDYFG